MEEGEKKLNDKKTKEKYSDLLNICSAPETALVVITWGALVGLDRATYELTGYWICGTIL